MYSSDDTIIAVSSPTSAGRVIIRVTGAETIEKLNQFFDPAIDATSNRITEGQIHFNHLETDATCYFFVQGHSYTSEDLVELHFISNQPLTEATLNALLESGLRMAEPGEFTARAYMNGRIDLAQAEAVNKVISCSNRLQLAAAEKLLSGRVTDTTSRAARELLQILSLLEAGMDFSEEDIDFITAEQAIERLSRAQVELEKLLSGSISLEAVLGLPSVGIAGAPNAGKSSILNALLGSERSIVSNERKTTRDVLTGLLELEHNRCVLFDCAGLIPEPQERIDNLAQQAAIESLNNSTMVLFCVDISKDDLSEDIAILKFIDVSSMIPVMTKSDLSDQDGIQERIAQLNDTFNCEFISVSTKSGNGIENLLNTINSKVTSHFAHGSLDASVALMTRHKKSVSDAVDSIAGAVNELQGENHETAAMMIRAAYQALGTLETEHIDEKLLDNIFSEFCIGK